MIPRRLQSIFMSLPREKHTVQKYNKNDIPRIPPPITCRWVPEWSKWPALITNSFPERRQPVTSHRDVTADMCLRGRRADRHGAVIIKTAISAICKNTWKKRALITNRNETDNKYTEEEIKEVLKIRSNCRSSVIENCLSLKPIISKYSKPRM